MNPTALGALLDGDLENAIVASTPGGIEAQEARGQQEFVADSTLPIECLYCTREQLKRMGIVFGEPVDDLFINAQLPEGWKKVATDHSMWSHLVDDRGRNRASIFYKAAFYDRSAHISLVRRFSIRVEPADGHDSGYDKKTCLQVCIVTGRDVVIWTSETMAPSKNIEWFNLSQRMAALGAAWLDEHYPNWRDPLAYWD